MSAGLSAVALLGIVLLAVGGLAAVMVFVAVRGVLRATLGRQPGQAGDGGYSPQYWAAYEAQRWTAPEWRCSANPDWPATIVYRGAPPAPPPVPVPAAATVGAPGHPDRGSLWQPRRGLSARSAALIHQRRTR